jgi:AraC-like DNA-binding protein
MKPYFEQNDKVIKDKTLIILLVDIAKQRGVHPDKLLKGTRLFEHDLAKPQLGISQNQFTKLIMNTRKLIKNPDIPFILGSRLFPIQLGQIGLALSNTQNIEDMLRIIKCYQCHIFPFMFIHEKRHNNNRYLIFNHAITIENEAYHMFMCELLTSVITSAIKWRMNDLPSIKIKFSYSQPEYTEQYQAYLGSSFSFSAIEKQNVFSLKKSCHLGVQIAISNDELKKPFMESNQVIKRYHLNQIKNDNASLGIIQFIIQNIDKYFENGEVTLENIALTLNVSPATLKRKLASHNTSYQKLLDLYRQQQAVFLLTELNLSNQKVAKSLNFSDITNFRRSFKRWTGTTPNALKMAFNNSNCTEVSTVTCDKLIIENYSRV